MIDWRGLFQLGETFSQYRTHGFPEERAAVDRIEKLLHAPGALSTTVQQRIASLNTPFYLLVAAEMWCPDCHRNVTAFNALCERNTRIQMRIVTRSRAERSIAPAMELTKVAIPFAVVLDSSYSPLGTFTERPANVVQGGDSELARYRANQELESAIVDILNLLAPHA